MCTNTKLPAELSIGVSVHAKIFAWKDYLIATFSAFYIAYQAIESLRQEVGRSGGSPRGSWPLSQFIYGSSAAKPDIRGVLQVLVSTTKA